MELVEGMGLNFLIETRSNQLEGKRVDYLIQLADGLEYLHKHRLLAPRHLPAQHHGHQDGVVKLIDFGLAIPNTPEFCRPGNRTGTPKYLAPELIRRTKTDVRVDLFALGVTAYEMFTGDLPWEKAESMQTLLSHMNSPGRDPLELRPDLDPLTVDFFDEGDRAKSERAVSNPRRLPSGPAGTAGKVVNKRAVGAGRLWPWD